MLPRLEIAHRIRPVDLVAQEPTLVRRHPGAATLLALPRPAPYAAVVAELARPGGRVTLGLHSGTTGLVVTHAGGRVELEVTDPAGRVSTRRSRRHGRTAARPTAVAATLTGSHLTAWTREADTWVARGRVDLAERVDTRDEAWLAALQAGHRAEDGAVSRLVAGGFGQLGLRDLRLVTTADGVPLVEGGSLWLTATSAGPGFFDTAHTSVWRLGLEGLDTPTRPSPAPRPPGGALEHTADLFFRRPDRPGVYGDHATHVVRDSGPGGTGWLVATSTWGDFDAEDPERHVRVTLARTDADLLRGEHVLDTRPLPLPTAGLPREHRSVGVWDPHLVRADDGWLVGFVSARTYFSFHPCLATGPDLASLTLAGAATDRTATEGTTLVPVDGEWLVLASDGPDGPRRRREAYPAWDTGMRPRGALDAPYPSNIPWPTLAQVDGRWLMVTFDGTPAGGRLLGYGTHGDVVVMREV